MRTIERARANARRSGIPRIGSLLMLGVLVLLLSSYARESKNWHWLTNEDTVSPTTESESAPLPAKKATPAEPTQVAAANAQNAPAEAEAEAPEAPVAKAPFAGPTDQDPEQQQAIQEEFQALSDGSLKLLREEMTSYWRIFTWTKNQTAEEMLKRAKPVSLDDMLQRPDEVRGQLVRIDLNLRRVLSYQAPENSAGVETVYEGWGWSETTKQWLYEFVSPEIPAGMPIGPNIQERVTFVGYFFKVQGYHAANSKPNERPLSAPLLIGRVIWHPAKPVEVAKNDPWWMWAIMAAIGVVVLVACVWPWIRPRPPAKALKSGERRRPYEEIMNDSTESRPAYDEEDDRSGPLSYLNGHSGSAESN